MGQNSSIAANLKPEQRKQLFIEMQSSSQTVTAIANREGVSRKFLYQQQQKGNIDPLGMAQTRYFGFSWSRLASQERIVGFYRRRTQTA